MARTCPHVDAIIALAATDAGTTPTDVAEQTGMRLASARSMLNKLVARGRLTVTRLPLRGGPKLYKAAP
jgi:DNA-binding IclR family transcriptional regulator